MAADQLSKKNPDGTVLGQSSTDKIGFFGKTAITLRSLPASLAVGSSTTSGRTAINQMRNMLKNYGLGV